MKHCIELLDDYIDGELSDLEASAVDEHLASCPDCAAEHQALVALVALAGRLPDGMSGEDRWPEVAEQLRNRPASRRISPLAVGLAAAALLAIGVGLATWPSAPTVVEPAPHERTEPDVVADLQALVTELEALVAARDLDPEVAAQIADNLRTIDDAIAEIEAALADHPHDPQLTRSLARAYQHKIGVLSLVARS